MAYEDVDQVFKLAYQESVAREESPELGSPVLSPIDRLVWAVLAHHKNHKTGLCCPSYERLMKFTGLGRTALADSLQRLKSDWISVERHGRASRYSWEFPELAEALPDDEVRETNFSSSPNEPQKAAKRISEVRETASNRVLKPGRESRRETGMSSLVNERDRHDNSNNKSNDSGRAPNPPVSDGGNSPVKYHPDVQFLAETWRSCFKSDIDSSLVNTWYKKWGTDNLRRAFRFVSREPLWLKNVPDAETFDSLIVEIMKAADPNNPDSAPPDEDEDEDVDVDWDTEADLSAARPQSRSGTFSPPRRPAPRAKGGAYYNHRIPKDLLKGHTLPAPIEEDPFVSPKRCLSAWKLKHPSRPRDEDDFDFLLDHFDEDDILNAIDHFTEYGNRSEEIRTTSDFRDNFCEILEEVRPPDPPSSDDREHRLRR